MKKSLSRLFVQNFLSHGTEKFCWGIIQCIRKVRLSKKLFAWEGDITILCRKFCLTVPKNFVGDSFYVSKKFLYRKFSYIRGGGGHHGSAGNFLSHSAEKFRRGTLLCCVSENFRQPKSLWIRGGGGVSRVSVENFLFHDAEKFRSGTL